MSKRGMHSAEALAPASAKLRQFQHRMAVGVDRLMAWLLAIEWAGAIAVALILSPRTWSGAQSALHPHVRVALLMGPGLVLIPAALVLLHPGKAVTRHVIAVCQILMSALLIDITDGRIETHFHVFGSLAFLALYRDWRVLLTASLVTAADHFIRGIWWPQSVYGTLTSSPWRWLEHGWWVGFEDFVLIYSFRQFMREMWGVAKREARLAHGAYHDVLTGLPNRRLLKDRFARSEDHPAEAAGKAAVFFVDLDRFKHVNDTLGHAVGDKLLVSVAERLGRLFRASDTVARIGGDEFVVLIDDPLRLDRIDEIAEQILNAFSEPFEIGEHQLLLSASVGVSLAPEHGSTLSSLQGAADLAMYEAKAKGRYRWAMFSQEMLTREQMNRDLARDLYQASSRGEFEVHFQPQVGAREELIGFEALMRWKHPERGYVPPSQFIPLAEKSGLIVTMGAWVLEQACRCCAGWDMAGYGHLQMSVNVSAVQLELPEFPELVLRIVEASGVDPHTITLEITETALMKNAALAATHLRKIRDKGIRIALDDFGTGYSSLKYLETLPADTIKLDNSFVGRGVAERPRLVESILEMAHRNGLDVTAEGVETKEQSEYLRGAGCDSLQGYYYGKPLGEAGLIEWIEQYSRSGVNPKPADDVYANPSDSEIPDQEPVAYSR